MTLDAGTDAARSLTFVCAAASLLPRAEARGERLVTALYLILRTHTAVVAQAPGGGQHLTCAECRPRAGAAGEQYPCPTAQQAFWALDAMLR